MNKNYLRLIDANLNRCREGMRVVEDTARFVRCDRAGYTEARRIRHQLDLLTRAVYPRLLAERESVQDAGRTLVEGKRESIAGVLAANFRRAEESLRVLEEYSRLIAPAAGPSFKELRYAAYVLEKKMVAAGASRKTAAGARCKK
jgi:hypothetical protein